MYKPLIITPLQTAILGTIFWDLQSGQSYVAGTNIFCNIFVYNPTSVDRDYMLTGTTTRGSIIISSFPVLVNGLPWFTVQAGDILVLPGMFNIEQTDVALTLDLTEKITSEIASSISTGLTSSGTEQYPLLPGLPGQITPAPTTDVVSAIMPIFAIMMLGMIMSSAFKKKGVK